MQFKIFKKFKQKYSTQYLNRTTKSIQKMKQETHGSTHTQHIM